MFDPVDAAMHAALDGRVPSAPMTRRHRGQILAVDRRDDLVGVLIARRSRRRFWNEVVVLEQVGDDFITEGVHRVDGDGVSLAPTADRRREGFVRPRWVSISGWSSHAHGSHISFVVVQVTRDVVAIKADGQVRPISPTGWTMLTWRGRQPPIGVLIDDTGNVVEDLSRFTRSRQPGCAPWWLPSWLSPSHARQGSWRTYGRPWLLRRISRRP